MEIKKTIKQVPHDKPYCYLKIVDLLGRIVKEDSKIKRILWYREILAEVKHLI